MSIIKSFSTKDVPGIESGDMFYIKHNVGSFTIIDCCMDDQKQDDIIREIENESSGKGIKRFISTHPDEDHIKGLRALSGITNQNFYCVENSADKNDPSLDFEEYCKLRSSERVFYLKKGCVRYWLNQGDDVRGSAGISVLWPDVQNEHYKAALDAAKNKKSPNNICPIILYSADCADYTCYKALWMGDLETSFMENIKDDVNLEKVNLLFAPHHGRDSGKVPKEWLDKLAPDIIVLGNAPSEHLNYYPGYNTIKQNSAGDILFELNGRGIDIYCENRDYNESFLSNQGLQDNHGLCYLGTLR